MTLGCENLGAAELVQWLEEDWPGGLGYAVGPSEMFEQLEGVAGLEALGTWPCVLGLLESLAEVVAGPCICGPLVGLAESCAGPCVSGPLDGVGPLEMFAGSEESQQNLLLHLLRWKELC